MTLATMFLLLAGPLAQDPGVDGTTVTVESMLQDLQAIPLPEDWVEGLRDRFVESGVAADDIHVLDIPAPDEKELKNHRQNLQRRLQEAGMGPIDVETIVRQEEKRLLEPARNLSVVLPGSSDRFLLVGAPFDPPEFGAGMIDNWSSAAMLVALHEACRGLDLAHSIHFVAFGAEETGARGSAAYAASMEKEKWKDCAGVIILDCLGMAPPAAWKASSSAGLLTIANMVARRREIPFQAQEYIDTSSRGGDVLSFRRLGVPSLYVNGLNLEQATVLHTEAEQFELIRAEDYVDTFRLLVGALKAADRVDGQLRSNLVNEQLPVQEEDLKVPLARYRLLGRDGPRLIALESMRAGRLKSADTPPESDG